MHCLAGGERIALCTILRLTGSGPRGAGAKMAVRDGGEPIGSVGGGVLERKATAWAEEALRTGRAACKPFALDLSQASEEGMTCGGQAELLVEPLDGALPAVRDLFGEALALLRRGGRGWMVTALRAEGDGVAVARYLAAGGACLASAPVAGQSVPDDLLASPPSTPTLLAQGAVRYFLEPLAPRLTLYVCGGGHIALHLVPLCKRLGFWTVVLDDRPEFVTRKRFPLADELLPVPGYQGALDGLPVGEGSYVVIVTRGHGGDLEVLRQALARRPDFVGMIGSARKRALVFAQLAAEGVSPEALARVACPIGLPIGAETPEEIAVSIAAQLVAVRRGRG
jgi:xanthine dehydrogenase accessory factor